MRLMPPLILVTATGCASLPHFPVQPVQPGTHLLAFDTDADGRDDYWQDVNADGRKTTLHFDTDGDGAPDADASLDGPPADDDLHVLIVLDGVPFELVQELYEAGHFRLFPPPSRLISVFPALTDLALAKLFRAGPCLGYEALYYDAGRGRLSDGNQVYLSGANEPWTRFVDYRCDTSWDVRCYLDPQAVWRHELADFTRLVRQAPAGTLRLYTVATAGLGTRGGAPAIREYLQTIDAFCERMTFERRGKVRFTLLADHGHGLTPCKRVSLRPVLEAAGLHVTKSLQRDDDVVLPTFGLVTCGVLHTNSEPHAAEALLKHEGVDLVMYRTKATETANPESATCITVLGRTGEARILRLENGLQYETVSGDPLRLGPILAQLQNQGKVASDGGVSERDWFAATCLHEYPDPVRRIWQAFQPGDLVEHTADVIFSMRDGYSVGSGLFSLVVQVKSTHGTLSRRSSTTFVLSNQAALPAVMNMEVASRWAAPAREPTR